MELISSPAFPAFAPEAQLCNSHHTAFPLGEDPTDVPTTTAGELPWIQLPVPPSTGCSPSIAVFPPHP